MPDLLTHVLAAYVLATALSVRYEWLTPRYTTIAMGGALVPDLSRMDLLVPAEFIEGTVAVPFSWGAFHTLGGVLVTVTIGALCTTSEHRRRVGGLLLLGACLHLLLDAFLLKSSGYS